MGEDLALEKIMQTKLGFGRLCESEMNVKLNLRASQGGESSP